MSQSAHERMKLPPEQEAIRAQCFHPSGNYVEFKKEEIEQSIPERFEKIVNKFPDRIAVKSNRYILTYDELNRGANRIAHAILEKCGDRLSPIIVLTDQSPEAIMACLGVLKAGKIMVPVDPLFPADRLTFMADDSKAEAILTPGVYVNVATQLVNRNRKVINVGTIRRDISTENIDLKRSPLDPSGIRYTSGSTGQPKGVLSSHRKTLFQCTVRVNTGHICPEDRLLILRRWSFVPRDTLAGLLAGAALFPFDIKEQTLRSLRSILQNEKITYFASTPSVFRYIAQELTGLDECLHLRMIELGGEPLFRSDVELYKKHFPKQSILLNQLTSAEMGTTCQYWITKETRIDTVIVPVGYPVDGKQVVLLDDEQKQVGVNETGEIAVASRYLSTGYWNDTGLTNDKFLTGNKNSDERLYLSGDLGRMLPDGCLLYVGRKDDQVKIRGAKVEIGEVEAVLSEYPGIKQSRVVAFDRKSGEKYLTAYIVSHREPASTVSEINDHLRKKLPDYMIPSAFMFLDSLPLTNGKLDRKALPRPDDRRPKLRTPYYPAQNEVEKSLIQIWEEVLDVRPVGIHDNFFDLGGHSLAASRIISRVFKTFRLELPIKALYDSPAVANMAAVIIEHQAKKLDREELDRILAELEAISDEEAQRLVSKPSEIV